MKFKKQYGSITLYFEILNDIIVIDKENILKDIVESLNGFKFINKNKKFNDLIKEQGKYPKHVLVDFIPCQFDELKFIIKSIYNFLLETNQDIKFLIDKIHVLVGDEELIIYSTEVMRKNLDKNTSFSPSIRACWKSNPGLIENILKRQSSIF